MELLRRGHDVTAVDLEPAMLERLEAKITEEQTSEVISDTARLRTIVMDMNQEFPEDISDGNFDLAVSLRATRYVTDRHTWFNRIRQALRPGGHFILPVFFALDALPWPQNHSDLRLRDTTPRALGKAMTAVGLQIDTILPYSQIAVHDLDDRNVPPYYAPTIISASRPYIPSR